MMRLLLMLALGLGVETGRAAIPAQKCAGAKVRAGALEIYAKTKCHQKALRSGGTVDGACVAKTEQKFAAAFVRAEAAGGCVRTGDAAVAEAVAEACVASFAGAIKGDAKCAAAKMKAVGKKTYAKAR